MVKKDIRLSLHDRFDVLIHGVQQLQHPGVVALRLLKSLDFLIHCVQAVVEFLQLRLKRTLEGRISLNRSLQQGIFHFLDTFLA